MYLLVLTTLFCTGTTNSFIRKGALVVEDKKRRKYPLGSSIFRSLWCYLSTPSYLIPQFLNLCGGALFAVVVPKSPISVAVPLANGISIAVNALTDHFLGESIPLWPGVPGVILVLAGVILCSLN